MNKLIGTEVSLYTGKLRCYLKYKNIPFEDVLSTNNVYKNIIIPRTGVQYIPVLITDDDVALQDTTEIIDYLESQYPDASIYPETPIQKLVALLLEIYGDEWLVIPAMHYRWSFDENVQFAWQEFGRTAVPDLSAEQQFEVGKKMAEPFKGALPRLGICEATIPAIEASYLALLSDLDAHFSNYDYLLGPRPSIGDFGLVGPLYAHLYRDPYSGRLMQDNAPNVVTWIERMINPAPNTGAFLADDQIPETLLPVLARMIKEQGSVIMQTIDQVKAWADTHDDNEIHRAIGKVTFDIEGVQSTRLTFPYMQWMWQRAVDFYQGLGVTAQNDVNAVITKIEGLQELLNYPIPQRVRRRQNKVVLDR
ncbi:glutathione S-transferase family protein [Ketobacter alkanivorans]|uniref:GST N-terminal domain-containing protein n=1 Tax=Ketobacter alkanivorans TaxID=1917421 RepID=A0A2K9LJ64_9GAMM|nr:glutathione S-transferase family protein [Ketobacter alkanivorans]AUM12312.1 hypothetical protein Kalk_07745 [Ketobacter alkanivorans]